MVDRADAPDGHKGATVAKLLIASRPAESPTYLSMSHDEAQDFIERRFEAYAQEKRGDWYFFPDELIQFLAHKAGVPQVAVDGDQDANGGVGA